MKHFRLYLVVLSTLCVAGEVQNTPVGNALTVATTLQDHTRAITQEFQTGLRRASLEDFLTETRTAGDLIVRTLNRTEDLVTSFKHVAVDQTSEVRRDFDLSTTLEEIAATLSPMLKPPLSVGSGDSGRHRSEQLSRRAWTDNHESGQQLGIARLRRT